MTPPAIYNHDILHAQMRSFGMDDFDFETLWAAHDERRRHVIERYVRLMLRVIAMETRRSQAA
jgi:hypothetical protein